jgi:hypothetical protein
MATQRPMTSPIPTRKKAQSTFDAELRDFMRETELTARKIVKDANKKASDERKKEVSAAPRVLIALPLLPAFTGRWCSAAQWPDSPCLDSSHLTSSSP